MAAATIEQQLFIWVNTSHALDRFPIVRDVTWHKKHSGIPWETKNRLPPEKSIICTGDGVEISADFTAQTGEALSLDKGTKGEITFPDLVYGVGLRVTNQAGGHLPKVKFVVVDNRGVSEEHEFNNETFIGAYSRLVPLARIRVWSEGKELAVKVSGVLIRQTEVPILLSPADQAFLESTKSKPQAQPQLVQPMAQAAVSLMAQPLPQPVQQPMLQGVQPVVQPKIQPQPLLQPVVQPLLVQPLLLQKDEKTLNAVMVGGKAKSIRSSPLALAAAAAANAGDAEMPLAAKELSDDTVIELVQRTLENLKTNTEELQQLLAHLINKKRPRPNPISNV